ncbi:hypothetical protein CPB84DRAFT_1762229 [Gymnopilus junonius]|uniref:FCH domain-containing protein n=1 Tax=Gymnopilus junonius TaxID=109634 RepID=A0A9P5NWG8_GYMJU|nr:hypothetical protein CPB84DRAFT_1762229 [Gymnopilus junonius]
MTLVGCHPDLLPESSSASGVPSSDNVFKERAGDSITEALSAYMQGASTTTDELTRFWMERGAIELQYASSLAQIAEKPFGRHEPSEFRNVIDGFRLEVARQAMAHNTLAKQIAVDLEARCLELKLDQSVHLRDVCEPAIKRMQEETIQDNSPSVGISSEWKKEYRNLRRLLDIRQFDYLKNFKHRRESLPSRRNYFTEGSGRRVSSVASSTRSREWRDLLKSCEEMEANRSQFMKDLLSTYADILSSIQAADLESYNNIMRTFDLFRSEDVLEDFVKSFLVNGNGTKDHNSRPPVSSVKDAQAAPPSTSRASPERTVKVQRRSTMSGLGRFSGPRPRPFNSRPSSQIVESDKFSRPFLTSGARDIRVLSTTSPSQTVHGVDDFQRRGQTRPLLPKLQTNLSRDDIY